MSIKKKHRMDRALPPWNRANYGNHPKSAARKGTTDQTRHDAGTAYGASEAGGEELRIESVECRVVNRDGKGDEKGANL